MTTTNTTRAKSTRPAKTNKVGKVVASQPATDAPTPKTSKSDALIALLSRPEGATIDAMMSATGWQAHSVRGFLAGALKKKLGKAVTSEKAEAGRVYRIAEASPA